MKKIIIAILLCTIAQNVNATCYKGDETSLTPAGSAQNTVSNCSTVMNFNVSSIVGASMGWYGRTCSTCASGYNRVQKTASISCGTYTYYDCEAACGSCTGVICNNFNSWSAYNTTHRRRNAVICSCGSCINSGYEYACEAGYYGKPFNSLLGCTACPNGGTSKSFGGINMIGTITNETIDGCYQTTGTTASDTSGTFEYTADCYYSN